MPHPHPYLEVWPPSGVVDRVELTSHQLTVGRTGANDVVIADEQASRLHAVIERLGEEWCIRDINSRNGTFVNGNRIVSQYRLTGGDEVRIGRTRLVLRAVQAEDDVTLAVTPPPRLTPREQDVLFELFRPSLLSDGFTEPASPREIAGRLWVTEGAVKHHLTSLYGKFAIDGEGERRRTRLANEALRRGAVTMSEVRARLLPEASRE